MRKRETSTGTKYDTPIHVLDGGSDSRKALGGDTVKRREQLLMSGEIKSLLKGLKP
jgi:hypothetical protein